MRRNLAAMLNPKIVSFRINDNGSYWLHNYDIVGVMGHYVYLLPVYIFK